jgi:hypothetical protein
MRLVSDAIVSGLLKLNYTLSMEGDTDKKKRSPKQIKGDRYGAIRSQTLGLFGIIDFLDACNRSFNLLRLLGSLC